VTNAVVSLELDAVLSERAEGERRKAESKADSLHRSASMVSPSAGVAVVSSYRVPGDAAIN
jgi:hypothetical protein